MVQRSPWQSTRRTASRICVSHMQEWQTLHEEDLHPYHDQWVQRLEPGDPAQRMDLCHWITAQPKLLRIILFTDEASFTRDSINNSRNLHTWSHDNLHATSATRFKKWFSVNVWCGLLGNKLISLLSFTVLQNCWIFMCHVNSLEPKDNYDISGSVYVDKLNGFMSLRY